MSNITNIRGIRVEVDEYGCWLEVDDFCGSLEFANDHGFISDSEDRTLAISKMELMRINEFALACSMDEE